ATNEDNAATTVGTTVRITDAPPTVTLTGSSHSTTVGSLFSINFSAVDPSPNDVPRQWRVNWGDGNIETFGATTTSATHIYTNPGVALIRVNETDKDTEPTRTNLNSFAADIGISTANVTVDANTITASAP